MSKKEIWLFITFLSATLIVVGLLTAIITRPANAEPAQQFGLRLHAPAADGPLSFELTARMFDTAGASLPAMDDFHVRFPAGVRIDRTFLSPHYQCDGPALRDALNLSPSHTPFTKRILDLEPFIRSLERDRSKRARAALDNARTCERARLGDGTAMIDGSRVSKGLPDPIPSTFAVFLSRPATRGAFGGYTVVGAADETSPIARRFPIVSAVHAAITNDIVDDPSADGRYGYRLMLPTGRINGLDVSITEVHTRGRGPAVRRGDCRATDDRGRCRARWARDAHLLTPPSCPPSGRLQAQLFAGFPAPLEARATTIEVPCPRYERGPVASISVAARTAAATVAVRNDSFTPRSVTVDKGDSVGWSWRSGGAPHNVVSSSFASSPVLNRGTWSVRFRRAGSFRYVCNLHPGMTGTVVVRS